MHIRRFSEPNTNSGPTIKPRTVLCLELKSDKSPNRQSHFFFYRNLQPNQNNDDFFSICYYSCFSHAVSSARVFASVLGCYFNLTVYRFSAVDFFRYKYDPKHFPFWLFCVNFRHLSIHTILLIVLLPSITLFAVTEFAFDSVLLFGLLRLSFLQLINLSTSIPYIYIAPAPIDI